MTPGRGDDRLARLQALAARAAALDVTTREALRAIEAGPPADADAMRVALERSEAKRRVLEEQVERLGAICDERLSAINDLSRACDERLAALQRLDEEYRAVSREAQRRAAIIESLRAAPSGQLST